MTSACAGTRRISLKSGKRKKDVREGAGQEKEDSGPVRDRP